MPVYKGNLKHIDANNVLTLAGQRAVDDATPELAEEVCQTVVRLAQPVSVFYQFFYDKDTHTFLCNDPFVIEGETVRNYLENTEVAIIMAVTLGKEVEDACDELFMQKNFTKGILMDSAISIATEQMVGQLCGYIDTLGAPEGYKILWRITPGHSDTPQKQEVTLVPAGCPDWHFCYADQYARAAQSRHGHRRHEPCRWRRGLQPVRLCQLLP